MTASGHWIMSCVSSYAIFMMILSHNPRSDALEENLAQAWQQASGLSHAQSSHHNL
jgi:hypothetical protein